jgi:membrane protein required for colicin V production
MTSSGLNTFDAVVIFITAMAVALGFMTGLLRSLATILGYAAALPVAILAAPLLAGLVAPQAGMPQVQNGFAFAAVFIVAGLVISALLRNAVSSLIGPDVSVPDRLAGALLGGVRMVLVAVVVVLVFDKIIPPQLEPDFLVGSRLRPILSELGKMGLKSLPPEVENYIDRLKRERGL